MHVKRSSAKNETSLGRLPSHLCPTQAQIKAMEVPQAFVGEAGAAMDAGDVGQRREIVVQQRSFACAHIQHAVTETSSIGLKDEVSMSAHIIHQEKNLMFCLWESQLL